MAREHPDVSAATPSGSHWLRRSLVAQFGRPSGFFGHVAGWSMAHRPSNRRRNKWTVDLLGLHAGDRALEIGFGPGLALAHLARIVGSSGYVAGIDASPVMLHHAQRRNRVPIDAGWMDLRVGTVERLPDFGVKFDAILAVNTIGFWPDPTVRLAELRKLLRSGGRLAVTVQPRSPKATAATSQRVLQELTERLTVASFEHVTPYTLALDPPAVCVIGR